ncbi:MAG: AraC family ligand binding domain-containing protein, partial [Verrucomicrobiota bacterium]
MRVVVETITSSPQQSFTCLGLDLEAFDNDYHRHVEIELTWIEKSSGKRLIGDSLETFSEGDLVLIGSNLPHQYRSEGSGPARAKVIQFPPDWLGERFGKWPEFREIPDLLQRAARGLVFSRDTSAEVTPLIAELFTEPEGFDRAISLL